MKDQTNTFALIGNQLQQFSLSLLASRDEKAIEGRISAIDNNLTVETQCLWTTEDPVDKASIKANISTLQDEQHELTQQLAKASDVTLRLIRPAPGTIVSTLPTQFPARMPHINVPMFDNPTNLIILPDPPLPAALTSVAPPNVMFTTPLTMMPITTTKCSKSVHSPRNPAKCLKSTDHQAITRSASRNALINQSAEDVDMDRLIDHSETMASLVCPLIPCC
jgi:hypothetical protein